LAVEERRERNGVASGSFRGAATRVPTLILAALLALACSVPVAANLDETDANRAIVVLERGGIGASKERDPEHEGRFRVSVATGDASAAIGLLAREELPPRNSPGVLEALGDGSIVPSRLAEHARWSLGVAGELERSLRAVDGVLTARVHLAVPPRDSLAPEAAPERPSAAVLVRHRGATPPVALAEVQRLVAGAVPGLSPEHVSVVMAPSAVPTSPGGELLRLGPITVTRGSAPAVRWIFGAAVVLNLALVGTLLFLWTRLRRAEASLAELRLASESERAGKR